MSDEREDVLDCFAEGEGARGSSLSVRDADVETGLLDYTSLRARGRRRRPTRSATAELVEVAVAELARVAPAPMKIVPSAHLAKQW